DGTLLRRVLGDFGVRAVIHLAGLKAVGESVEQPLAYYDNNVVGTLRLLEAMQDAGVREIVFSSSATVYGEPQRLPIDERHPLSANSPYGQTKLVIEHMLRDLSRADERWRVCLLRYFNPVGAHESGLIGEDPNGVPNNLMPFVLRVAAGQFPELGVLGTDYPTIDGTGVRDYIHVVDLAIGHVRALERLDSMRCEAINLGTGRGTSVLELVEAFERVNGVRVPRVMKPRRAGDVAACFADASLALARLGWKTERTVDDMCRDAWRWQRSSGATVA
ncbi:MAG: UDP-glucose 4-epimerase GalE, partial [Actinobacteria bacterium]|nr:UDP-glucose 4-epimerase GalE [Actinomycetota bacterium]